MSDPLPAPIFNLTYDVKPTDIGAGYAAGIEPAQGNGKGFPCPQPTAADAKRKSRNPHPLLPTPELIRSMLT